MLSRQANSTRCLAREGKRLLSSYVLANGGGSVHAGPRDCSVPKGWPRTCWRHQTEGSHRLPPVSLAPPTLVCTVSGISIPSEVPPKTSSPLRENLGMQARASCCPSAQLCCGARPAGRSLTGKERGLNLEVSSSPSNQQAPGAPLGAPLRANECLLHEK